MSISLPILPGQYSSHIHDCICYQSLFFREVCISTPLDFHLLLLSVQYPWRCESHTHGHREGRSGVYKSPHQPVPPDQEAVQPVEGGSAAHTGQWHLCQRYRLGEVYFTIEIFIKFFGTNDKQLHRKLNEIKDILKTSDSYRETCTFSFSFKSETTKHSGQRSGQGCV